MAYVYQTILDYSALMKDDLTTGFIMAMLDAGTAGGGGNLLQVIPAVTINALSRTYTRFKDEGPQAPTFRPIGGVYNTGYAVPVQENVSVSNVGQEVIIDLAYEGIDGWIEGLEPEVIETKMLSARINRYVNWQLYAGDTAVTPYGFLGIRNQIDPNQVYSVAADIPNASSYTNGLNIWSATTKAQQLDLFTGIDRVLRAVGARAIGKAPAKSGKNNFALMMNEQVQMSLEKAGREAGVYDTTRDAWDREISTYKGIPIVNPGAITPAQTLKQSIAANVAIMANNLTFGTATTATEIVAIRLGVENEGCVLLQKAPLKVRKVAEEMQAAPAKLIRADWYPGFYRIREDAIAKLTGIIAV